MMSTGAYLVVAWVVLLRIFYLYERDEGPAMLGWRVAIMIVVLWPLVAVAELWNSLEEL